MTGILHLCPFSFSLLVVQLHSQIGQVEFVNCQLLAEMKITAQFELQICINHIMKVMYNLICQKTV